MSMMGSAALGARTEASRSVPAPRSVRVEAISHSRRFTGAILHESRTSMHLARLRASTCLAIATVITAAITGQGQQPSPGDPVQGGRSWPPSVQAVSRDGRPLTPTEALASFSLPPGYRVELVASEPLVQDPVAIDWDPDGRLWVVEMPGYMRDIAGGGEHDPIGRVVVLQDRDGDGKMDTRTVFADHLVLPRAVKVSTSIP